MAVKLLIDEVWQSARVEERLKRLPSIARIFFAAACADRSLWCYLKWARECNPSYGIKMRSILKDLWVAIESKSGDFSLLNKHLTTLEGLVPDSEEGVPSYGSEQAALAVLDALKCAISSGDVSEALDAAEESYSSFRANEMPKRVLAQDEIREYELKSEILRRELDFQVRLIDVLEREPVPTRSLLASL